VCSCHNTHLSLSCPPAAPGLDHTWGVELYGELLEIGGGKERMTKAHLNHLAIAPQPVRQTPGVPQVCVT